MAVQSSSRRGGDARAAVVELGLCQREGGARVLDASVAALDDSFANGTFTVDAVALEITQALRAGDSFEAALLWITVAGAFARHRIENRIALCGCLVIPALLAAMTIYRKKAVLQLCGLGAASEIIGGSLDGLREFINGEGFVLIERAMQDHPQEPKLQLRGIRQLAAATSWPDELRQEAGFVPDRAIALTKQAMMLHFRDADVQLTGMEALSKFVGTSGMNLAVFASGGGLSLQEEAMQKHPQNPRVQIKAIKGLASAVNWPSEVCRLANYCPERAIALTKQAMALHIDDLELQRIALERLGMYLPSNAEAIVRCGGGELLKAVLVRHCSDSTVQSNCTHLLNVLGEAIPSLSSREIIAESTLGQGGEMASMVELGLLDIEV